MESRVYIEMRSIELNDIINKFYGTSNFECALALPNSNTVLKEANITKAYSTLMAEPDYIKEMMTKGYCSYDQVTFILWDLCRNGVLAEGNYLIDCSW